MEFSQNMVELMGAVLLGASVAAQISSQPAPEPPAFDVAVFRPSPIATGDKININLGTARDNKVTLGNVTLSECVMFAYDLVSDSLIFGPDWIKSRAVRYDITAKAPPGTTRERLLLMLQSLLNERLALKSHREMRSMSYLAMVVGKNGSKLQPSEGSDTNAAIYGHIARAQITMPLLATLLSRFEKQIIVDETGLKGSFAIDLTWIPDNPRANAAESAPGPSLYTAVQEQLGFKLERRKGPLSVFVVDDALKMPKEN